MSEIGKWRRATGSTPDHAHKTVSEGRCAQELEEHPFLYDLAGTTIYHYVPDLKGGRLALAEATNTAELPQPSRSED